MSVARELLPNFPSQLSQPAEREQASQHSHNLSLQHQIRQQLQQQFQQQLQLNLQGRGESSSGPILPDPPDTILDLDQNSSASGESTLTTGHNGGSGASLRPGHNSSGGSLRPGHNSSGGSGLLDTLIRSAQAASGQQRINSSRDHSDGMTQVGSRAAVAGSTSHATTNSHSNNHSHHHQGQQRHTHSHSQNHLQSLLGAASAASPNSASSIANSSVPAGGTTTGTDPSAHSHTSPAGSDQHSHAATPRPQPPAELSLLYKWATESGVFVFLLLLHFLYDHRLGLLVFLCMGGTFYYTNMKLVHAIHQSAVRVSCTVKLLYIGPILDEWLKEKILKP